MVIRFVNRFLYIHIIYRKIMSLEIKIIDNFLSTEDLNSLRSLKLDSVKKKKMNVYVKKIKNNNILGTGIEDGIVKNLHKNYHSKAMKILEELYPEKIKLYEYSEFGISDIGENYDFPIHNDTPNKLLSGVIYLSPERSIGTKFYDNKSGDGEKNIAWKINRAVFFSRHEHKSWHSFSNGSDGIRRVLVYNLMTSNIKEVCKIEGINFYLSQFKHIINPYLHRFFNFVI